MRHGFTILELVVVVSIISAILLVAVSNFGQIRLNFSLARSAQKFGQDVRRAQNLASSANPQIISWPPIAGGYGVHLDFDILGRKQYIIYGDTNNNRQYNDGVDVVIETVDISKEEPGVFIKQIGDSQNNATETITIDALTLDTTITVRNNNSNDRVDIIFSLESDHSKTRTVTITNAGLIQVK